MKLEMVSDFLLLLVCEDCGDPGGGDTPNAENCVRGHFQQFWGSKKSFCRLFQSCFGLVWEVFGLCFRPQRAYFWVYFELQRSINDLEN